jgi:hypothetical protein
MATSAARKKIGSTGLRVLVDNTVLDLAVSHETLWVTDGKAGYQARVPVYGRENDSARYRELCYLTAIAHLARRGHLELCHSAELNDERFRQPPGRFRGYGYSDYSVLHGIELPSIDGWVFPRIGAAWMGFPSAQAQQRARLDKSDDLLFQQLRDVLSQQLGTKCSQDAWHVRTAERHDAFCFLTTDGNLLKAFRSLVKKEPLRSLKTRVLAPSDLATMFEVHPVSPLWLSYNDTQWFVRNDRTMPGEKRRRRGACQRDGASAWDQLFRGNADK